MKDSLGYMNDILSKTKKSNLILFNYKTTIQDDFSEGGSISSFKKNICVYIFDVCIYIYIYINVYFFFQKGSHVAQAVPNLKLLLSFKSWDYRRVLPCLALTFESALGKYGKPEDRSGVKTPIRTLGLLAHPVHLQ